MSVPSAPPDVAALLTEASTVLLRPSPEGNNISFAIGFKHVNYLAEQAVLDHFRRCGLPAGRLYRDYGLDVEVTGLRTRLGALLDRDDEVAATVTPRRPDGSTLRFEIRMSVFRDGRQSTVATSTATVAICRDAHVPAATPVPASLEPLVMDSVAETGPHREPPRPLPGGALPTAGVPIAATATDGLVDGAGGFGWRRRIPYFYCHYNRRMQMSGYLRVMEEIVDLFLADRGLPIRAVLDTRRWIPVVTRSALTMLAEAEMGEDLHTTFVVEDVFKNLFYTARMDCAVVRDGRPVPVATGSITHGYLCEHAPNDWRLAEMDTATISALLGVPAEGRDR